MTLREQINVLIGDVQRCRGRAIDQMHIAHANGNKGAADDWAAQAKRYAGIMHHLSNALDLLR